HFKVGAVLQDTDNSMLDITEECAQTCLGGGEATNTVALLTVAKTIFQRLQCIE
ncbi:hypothetical protein NPIL_216631, partial [Nephila pilipes]